MPRAFLDGAHFNLAANGIDYGIVILGTVRYAPHDGSDPQCSRPMHRAFAAAPPVYGHPPGALTGFAIRCLTGRRRAGDGRRMATCIRGRHACVSRTASIPRATAF